jgi:group I intron endonuclease
MFIYKITNKINGKNYVGQTTTSINNRFIQHVRYNKFGILHKAINKYGSENFTIEEIDGANSQSELNYLETHYIYKYESLAPSGYNLKEGGKAGGKLSSVEKNRLKQKCRKRYGRKIACINSGDVYNSISEAEDKLGIKKSNIIYSIRTKGSINGLNFCYFENWDGLVRKPDIKKNNKKPVVCINNGNVYSSINEAAKKMNLDSGCISSICKGKTRQTSGFSFCYLEKWNGNIHKNVKSSEKKPVKIVCTNNGQIYESIGEASRKLDLRQGSISNVLSKRQAHVKGYVFSKLKDWDGKINIKNPKIRKILCVNNGKIYANLSKASKELNIHKSNIQRVVSGKQKQAKGYVFKYL